MYITGKKSDESLVEVHLKKPEWELDKLKYAVVQNYGGSESDYSFFQASVNDEQKMRDGWEYDLVWSGGEITDIDWTPETNKVWIKMSATKTEINGDGIDSTDITLEVWKADLSGIANNVNVTADLPIKTPDGNRWVKATVTNGTLTKTFKTQKSGTWAFPGKRKRFESPSGQKARVFNIILIEVDETGVFD